MLPSIFLSHVKNATQRVMDHKDTMHIWLNSP